ncbi:MAG: hypothetical protein VX016_06800 [Verrucomicrobiota bacterium]|nr:hypothetical protein [Verrucomicrobiota bacterium]MEC7639164.1 hypothetical protein [Verrucomicrobiota bacterium]MEC8658883.1 hypothetical protein [Verrucomicrobiota bacterium]MEC8691251.1 hypothetical protein [Verrucomicrobiota bacterium]|tara:strand:- start:438 stop:629 length:192 start_codon:yes stop_codon:yes gene_type:complete
MANVLGTKKVLGMNTDKKLGSDISIKISPEDQKTEKVEGFHQKSHKKALKLFRWKIGDACFCD